MSEVKNRLRILITNTFVDKWTGSELYVHDLSVELLKRGHTPIIYTPRPGKLAELVRGKTIPVVNDLTLISAVPDLIHGQHHLETMIALAHFPHTPVVFFCHGWLPWEETPPIHPRIRQYVTVSDALRDRLICECGIPDEKVKTILNFVDLEKFRPRPTLPDVPKRALVFSNQATETNLLGAAREACARHAVAMDVIGYSSGNASFTPEKQLGNYDIIFARGRAALEGLATGAAVINCDIEGAGQMVSMQNLEKLRKNNFGIRVLDRPISAEILSEQIERYDPVDAAKVSQYIRQTAGLAHAGDKILEVYNTVLQDWSKNGQEDLAAGSMAFSNYLKGLSDDIVRVQIQAGQLQTERSLMEAQNETLQAALDQNRDLLQAEFDLNKALQIELDLNKSLKAELGQIKSRLTWRIYQRYARIKLWFNSHIWLRIPIKRWLAAFSKKKLL